jgi:transcriptional regulator with XRE-family HTH domain
MRDRHHQPFWRQQGLDSTQDCVHTVRQMAYLVKNVKELLGLMKRLQGERSSTEFASELGISKQYLTDIYKGRREPGDSVLRALDVARNVTYVAPASSPLFQTVRKEELQKDEKQNEPGKQRAPEPKAARPRKFRP